MSDDLVLLKTYPDETSALIAHAVLEAGGIASIVSADSAGRMEPHLQFARGTRLSVNSADVAVALELLGFE